MLAIQIGENDIFDMDSYSFLPTRRRRTIRRGKSVRIWVLWSPLPVCTVGEGRWWRPRSCLGPTTLWDLDRVRLKYSLTVRIECLRKCFSIILLCLVSWGRCKTFLFQNYTQKTSQGAPPGLLCPLARNRKRHQDVYRRKALQFLFCFIFYFFNTFLFISKNSERRKRTSSITLTFFPSLEAVLVRSHGVYCCSRSVVATMVVVLPRTGDTLRAKLS